tara:strand:- start:158 stop:430 length:273 start_codon:yes stop_codon:yes gene_type:complete
MPRYDYRCKICEAEFELNHSMSEVVTDCISCGAKDCITKLLSIPRIGKVNVAKNTGAVVKKAIKDYKERIEAEQGVWEDFDVDEIIRSKK